MIALTAEFILFSLACFGASVFGVLCLLLMPDRWAYERSSNGHIAFNSNERTTLGAFGGLALIILSLMFVSLPFLHPATREHGSVETAKAIFEHRADYVALMGSVATMVAGYLVGGIVWGIVYFGLYASRLQRLFNETKEAWLRNKGVTSLEALSLKDLEAYESHVYGTVKRTMFYNGDFPLKPTQQKRFFFANATLWPVSVLWYFLGEFMVDLAKSVWAAIKRVVRAYWEKKMALYLSDLAITRKYVDLLKEAKTAQRSNDRSAMDRVTRLMRETLQGLVPFAAR